MFVFRQFAEVRQLADIPKPAHRVARGGHRGHIGIVREMTQRQHIAGRAGAHQAAFRRRRIEGFQKLRHGLEIQHGAAPLQNLDRVVAVTFHTVDQFFVEGFAVAGDAESAVIHVAPSASGDLSGFCGCQRAGAAAVEFFVSGEGDMVHIHVQAHADGVGGHQEVDLARLIERHLGIAGPGLSEPITTAAPPRWRRINSAMA